jgi:hypothetical protein
MQIETNIDYPWPATECHAVLRDEVIPNLSLDYRIGYPVLSVPLGTVGLSIEEEEERACLIKSRVRFRSIIPQAIGPLLKIVSSRTAETRCSVEMVAESTAYYESGLANFLLDTMNKWNPGMLLYKFKGSPKILFGKEVVYDYSNFVKGRASQDMNVRAYKLIFRHLHEGLAARIAHGVTPASRIVRSSG